MSAHCPTCTCSAASASAWYMHDNHTFTRLRGTVADIVTEVSRLGVESPYGMLGAVKLTDANDREIRRVGHSVHARVGLPEDELQAWSLAVSADAEAVMLLANKERS